MMNAILSRLTIPHARCIGHCLIAAGLTITLAACGGEGAGDVLLDSPGSNDPTDPNDSTDPIDPVARRALEPFVGTYDITGSWNGAPADEALLVIREPSASAESEVVIYDFSIDLGNCYQVLRPGEAKQDPLGNGIFLDGIIQFDDAVLSLSGSTLVILYFDTFDGDADGDTDEQIVYTAPAVGQMEQDIGPLCQ